MTGDLDPLAAVRADAARLDALSAAGGNVAAGTASAVAAAGGTAETDPALLLLAALRGEIDAAVAGAHTPALRRDADLLDALAAGFGLAPMTDPALGLLHALRAAVDGVTVVPAVPSIAAPVRSLAVVAPPAAAGSSRRRRRVLRTGVAAGSVALALSMSGVAAAAYDSHPGGSLYSLRTQTFGRTDDDPVAAEQVLSDLKKQTAVAVGSPGDTAAVAKARALASQLNRYLAAERNHPAAQQSIAASAVTVVSVVDALPTPVVTRSRKPEPAASLVAAPVTGRHGAGLRSGTPAATPPGRLRPTVAALPPEPSPTSHAPDVSPGAVATPSSSPSSVPTESPVPSDSPTGTPSATTSSTGSPDPGVTPSGSPSASVPASSPATASPSSSDSPSALPTDKASPVRTTVAVKAVKPKAKVVKKKRVTATLMTAQLPSSGLPQR